MNMITLCENVECEARHECFRFNAQPVDVTNQRYSSFSGCKTPCEYFLDLKRTVDDGVIDPLGLYAMLERIVKGEDK